MRYDTRLGKYNGKPRPGGPRSTLCISSQACHFVSSIYLLVKGLLLVRCKLCFPFGMPKYFMFCSLRKPFYVDQTLFSYRLDAKWAAHSVLPEAWGSKVTCLLER